MLAGLCWRAWDSLAAAAACVPGRAPTAARVPHCYCCWLVLVVLVQVGFVESYNISVAAALIMWEARRIRTERLG